MEEAISHTLAMAVYPDNIQVDDFSSCEVGDFYYTATNISCRNGKVRPRLWEIKQSQRIDKYPKEIFPDERTGASLLIAEAQERCNIFQSHINNTYKLCSLPENNNEPTQKKMRKMAEWLDVYKNNKTSKLGFLSLVCFVCTFIILGNFGTDIAINNFFSAGDLSTNSAISPCLI